MDAFLITSRFRAISLRCGQSRWDFPSAHLVFYPHTISCSLRQSSGASGPQNGIFILGMGFVGQFLAADLKNKGWTVSGTCTSLAKKEKLEQMGFSSFIFDASDPRHEVLDIIRSQTHLLVSIPPVPGIGDPLLQHEDLVKSRLKDGNLRWLGYLSSTSVYGDCGGAWVDEDYPPNPTSDVSRSRLAAERGWLRLGHDLGLLAQIFRLGGIYGPGRSAVDTIINQEPLSQSQRTRSSRLYTSRIHVDDICQALNASIERPSSSKMYNIVDDDPAPREEVFAFALDLIKQRWPWLVVNNASEERVESLSNPDRRLRGEKRVCNARMKNELKVILLHPTYRSGLQSIMEHLEYPS